MRTICFLVTMLAVVLGAAAVAGEEPDGDLFALDLGPGSPESDDTASPAARQAPACLDREPDPRQTVRAAWRTAGLGKDDDLSRKRRVRVSGWLPKVSGGITGDRGGRWDHRLEPGEPRVDQLHRDDDLRWDAGLSWDLAEAAFRSEEIQVAREAARRARERMDLAAEIVRLYFLRRRVLRTGLPAADTERALRLEEATATLDAWTGHRFTASWCRPRAPARPGAAEARQAEQGP